MAARATEEMSREMLIAGPMRNGGCSPRSNPGGGMALRIHPNYPEEPSDTETREDGSDGRGRHRREWVDDRPMGSLLRRDNDGSSYACEENREVLPVPGSRQRGARG